MITPLLLASLGSAKPDLRPAMLHPLSDPLVPPRRAHHSLIYDRAGQRVILTGGSTPLDGGQRFEFFNDLWTFDGTRWMQLAPSGAKLSGSTLAFVSERNRIVAFGGYAGRLRLAPLRQDKRM